MEKTNMAVNKGYEHYQNMFDRLEDHYGLKNKEIHMTPFFKDVAHWCRDQLNNLDSTLCYFLGHHWGAWQKGWNQQQRCWRECTRCQSYNTGSDKDQRNFLSRKKS